MEEGRRFLKLKAQIQAIDPEIWNANDKTFAAIAKRCEEGPTADLLDRLESCIIIAQNMQQKNSVDDDQSFIICKPGTQKVDQEKTQPLLGPKWKRYVDAVLSQELPPQDVAKKFWQTYNKIDKAWKENGFKFDGEQVTGGKWTKEVLSKFTTCLAASLFKDWKAKNASAAQKIIDKFEKDAVKYAPMTQANPEMAECLQTAKTELLRFKQAFDAKEEYDSSVFKQCAHELETHWADFSSFCQDCRKVKGEFDGRCGKCQGSYWEKTMERNMTKKFELESTQQTRYEIKVENILVDLLSKFRKRPSREDYDKLLVLFEKAADKLKKYKKKPKPSPDHYSRTPLPNPDDFPVKKRRTETKKKKKYDEDDEDEEDEEEEEEEEDYDEEEEEEEEGEEDEAAYNAFLRLNCHSTQEDRDTFAKLGFGTPAFWKYVERIEPERIKPKFRLDFFVHGRAEPLPEKTVTCPKYFFTREEAEAQLQQCIKDGVANDFVFGKVLEIFEEK